MQKNPFIALHVRAAYADSRSKFRLVKTSRDATPLDPVDLAVKTPASAIVKKRAPGAVKFVYARSKTTMADAALDSAALGVRVFPVWGVTAGRCHCGKFPCGENNKHAGKHPITRHGFKDASSDPEIIREWWSQHPAANIGAATGAVSGIVVLDADGPKGLASLKALDTPATTPFTKTGRGYQQFFAHPGPSFTIGNRAGLAPGLDVRGDGGYCILPPSRHALNVDYAWLTPLHRMALAPLPEPLRALLVAPAGGEKKLRYRNVLEIPEGQRNDTLYRLGRSLVAKGITRAAIVAALLEENRARCRPPLPGADVRAIADHVVTQPDRPGFERAKKTETDDDASDGLGLVSVGTLLGEPDEAYTWIVEGRLPASGLGLLAGKPKAGKSTNARCLAFAVARGASWLGHTTTQGPVIYLALEEKRGEVREHFRDLGATDADPIYMFFGSTPADALDRLRREAERLHPVLIIIDPLFRFVRVDDGNDYATMTSALAPVMALARETGAHVLLVHHLGKGERNDAGDSVLGSTAIFGAVDTALLMKRTERYRTLSSLQRYGEDLEEITIELDPVARNVSAGGTRAEAEQAYAARLILQFLGGRSAPATEAELDDAVECRTQPRRAALRALVKDGRVLRIGHGGKAAPFRYLVVPRTRIPKDDDR